MNNYVTNDPLAVIYNESHWRLSKVSPMFSLQSSTVKFKQYASKIRQAIVSTIPANSALKFIVVFEAQPYLKYSEDDSEGLAITVSSSQESSEPKVIYTSIFLSWGVSTKIPGAVHLPFILERGEQRIGTAVKTTIQTMFDCNITQFCFRQHQLLQFGFNFVENDTSRSTDPFKLVYRTQQVGHKNKLSLTFEVGDVLIIWNGIKKDITKVSEQVTLAYQLLQTQVFYSVSLDVTALDLIEVTLPKAEVKSNGTIKMKTPEIVNCVFTVLNEIICTSTMDTKTS
ncbi:unnamed protein product [Parnassius apollo]|uniref:Centromere protein L n=1 Tax=Parnassius apollo TaxID=110799 RepID=A0A8S3Y778_PARAO|nr:unnamed protein product [Parnassius apollo]